MKVFSQKKEANKIPPYSTLYPETVQIPLQENHKASIRFS